MNRVMKPVRFIISGLIVFLDHLFSPKRIVRPALVQSQIDQQTSRLALYQFAGCPFCVKVRRTMKRLSLNIELRDVLNDQKAEKELLAGGKTRQVPCLRITKPDGTFQWLYESGDIITYLNSHFASDAKV